MDKTLRKFPNEKIETPEAKRSLKILGKMLMEVVIKTKQKKTKKPETKGQGKKK